MLDFGILKAEADDSLLRWGVPGDVSVDCVLAQALVVVADLRVCVCRRTEANEPRSEADMQKNKWRKGDGFQDESEGKAENGLPEG